MFNEKAVFRYKAEPETCDKIQDRKFYFSGAAVQVGKDLYSVNFDNLAVRRYSNIGYGGAATRCDILQQDTFLGEDCHDGSATNFCNEAIYLTGGRTRKGEPIRAVNKFCLNTKEWIPG